MFAVLAVAGSVAQAQARPRIGYAGTPKTEPVQQGQRQSQPAPVVVYNSTPSSSREAYIVNGAPYLVLNDGTVMVDFGSGYERILRPCAGSAPAPSPTDKNGLDAMGRLPLPLLNPLSGGERGQVVGTMPARNENACYRVTKHRRVQIVKG